MIIAKLLAIFAGVILSPLFIARGTYDIYKDYWLEVVSKA